MVSSSRRSIGLSAAIRRSSPEPCASGTTPSLLGREAGSSRCPRLVEAAGFEFARDDAEVPREVGVIRSRLVQEPLGVFATDEHLDRVPERMVGAASLVADDVDDHGKGRYRREFRCS